MGNSIQLKRNQFGSSWPPKESSNEYKLVDAKKNVTIFKTLLKLRASNERTTEDQKLGKVELDFLTT